MALPERILMGPGPSTVPDRVRRAMAAPTLGHLDPRFVELLDETSSMLRELFRTSNELTFPVSATGMGGMECVVANLLEPGDQALVCINGLFGGRMADMMERYGVTVHRLEKPWGEVFTVEEIEAEVHRHPKAKVLAIVHAETSTGAHQPLEGVAKMLHEEGMLLLVDVVTSLGGHEVDLDGWYIDAAYSATQKCLSCPPGLAPVSFSPAAVEVMERRKSTVGSWYFDIGMLAKYYQGRSQRAYHHTPPVNSIYGLHEGLRIILEEGIDARIERHAKMHRRLRAGLEEIGLDYLPEQSLHTLNCVLVPKGVDESGVRATMLDTYGVEIGGGLGPLAGKVWRIGLMGHSATQANVDLVLAALVDCLE
ncbi:alanine--glyoxylate aminotransferase [Haloferula helveola]|uniref:Alanine--glyoxylate aminotransferase n=1 Tax=Haloferula helveola TaxID=490095 RepID=A0ABM7RFL0_9BACT|nr:alanine--glyoxylate aminotransferase [Haloferula helveola]